MQKLAREEEKEEERQAERRLKRQRLMAEQDPDMSEEEEQLDEDDEEDYEEEEEEEEEKEEDNEIEGSEDEDSTEIRTAFPDNVPLHESLAPTKEKTEIEKASRTVFLANVSTKAISSKSAKKILLTHMSSFHCPSSMQHLACYFSS